jgi:hypothetical protein
MNQNTQYVPKLHPEMPDWKKVFYYDHHVTRQFPRLDGSFPDMTTPEYKKVAIEYVNNILKQEKLAYDKRVKQREEKAKREEEKKKQEEEEKKRKEEEHIAEMKKKYGYGWENFVEGTDEDCRAAWELRDENERQDEIDYYRSQEQCSQWKRECEEKIYKEEHQDEFFSVRMELETRGMTHNVKVTYIECKRREWQKMKWERMDELELEFQEEGDQWLRASRANGIF